MTMQEGQEGVVQFKLTFLPADPLPASMLGNLNAWRQILYRLGLIGQDPHRYGGLGFGNVSIRLESGNANSFIISGTQTGGLDRLPPHIIPVSKHLILQPTVLSPRVLSDLRLNP